MKNMPGRTACIDWEDRIIKGLPLIANEPIYEEEAEAALAVFCSLRIVDAPGQPTFGEACGDWVFDFVRAVFGSYNSETGIRDINEFFLCVSKKNGKSLIAAGIMLTALIRNWRFSNELIIIAPTIQAAGNAFKPIKDMIRIDPYLDSTKKGFLLVQDHLKLVTHLGTKATLKVLSARGKTVVGTKAGFVLIDELWEFGSSPDADSMMKEATGGMVERPEGFVVSITTMADKPPSGVFKDKLSYARDVRDGIIVDEKFLPVIYEFPKELIKNKDYEKPENFYITNPHLGRKQVSTDWIASGLEKESHKGPETRNVFLSKFLNIEIGQGLRTDNWAGASFWQESADETLTLDELIDRSEVAVIGIDGGGLDDLLGLCVLGREIGTRRWLVWCKAWAREIVLERRKEIASSLHGFARTDHFSIVSDKSADDISELTDIIEQVRHSGLLPEVAAIGVDPAGVSDIVDELERRGFTVGSDGEIGDITSVSQGYKLQNAIKTAERKLSQGEVSHDGSDLMTWCVGNAKVEQKGNALMITKQISGSAKIDPLMAFFNAVSLITLNPSAPSASQTSPYENPSFSMGA
jgi:phage terminase large subunit-like protein